MSFRWAEFLVVVTVVVAEVVGLPQDIVGSPQDTLQPVSYSGWKVLQVRLSEAAAGAPAGTPTINLNDLDDTISVNILNQNRQTGVAEVAVSPSALDQVTAQFTQHKVPFSTIQEDLGRQIERTEPNLRVVPELRGAVTFSRYMTYEEITAHVEGLQAQHPTKVKVEQAGRSVEGRPIYLMIITDNVANAHTLRKPAIFIDGGIHAREWVSPAAALGIVDNLIKTPTLTKAIEWRIIPLVNPDGYKMTWEKDRLWRKNAAGSTSKRCSGVDLNRNFGYHWGEAGSSSRQCSSVYRGPTAFSEPEAQAVRDAVLREATRTEAYVTIHSYGQMILHPWGYSKHVTPANNNELSKVGNAMARAIKKQQKKKYEVGSAAGILYAAAGGSDDWALGVAKIPLSYTIELRDTGAGGFLLPSTQIMPTVTDAWLAMKTLGQKVLRFTPRGEEAEVTLHADSESDNIEAEAMNPNQKVGQVAVIRNQEPVNQDQEGSQVVNRNQEEVIENQEGDQVAVIRNQEPVKENQEGGEIVNRNQEPVNQNQEGGEIVNRNQEPVNENQEESQVVNRNQEPVDENQEGSQIVNRNQEPVKQNQGISQVAVNIKQEPGTDQQVSSENSSEMETEEQYSSPQLYTSVNSNSQVRDVSEPLNEAPRNPETRSSFLHAPGGSVLLKILRGDMMDSSEEGSQSHSEE